MFLNLTGVQDGTEARRAIDSIIDSIEEGILFPLTFLDSALPHSLKESSLLENCITLINRSENAISSLFCTHSPAYPKMEGRLENREVISLRNL